MENLRGLSQCIEVFGIKIFHYLDETFREQLKQIAMFSTSGTWYWFTRNMPGIKNCGSVLEAIEQLAKVTVLSKFDRVG